MIIRSSWHHHDLIFAFFTWEPLVPSVLLSAIGLSMDTFIFQIPSPGALVFEFFTWGPLVLSVLFSAIGLSMDMFIFQFPSPGDLILHFSLGDLQCLQCY